jgi:hypothetical protein
MMGAGFVAGMEFTVARISNEIKDDPIYWPVAGQGIRGCGVFEHELEQKDWDI